VNILGIETSCDETAIAVLSGKGEKLKVKKNIVYSQIDIHRKYGGVVPEVAARKHLEILFPMLEKEVARSGKGIDAIAVTAGPGLSPALRTGVETAKTLAWLWEKPLVGVSHLEGHIYANWLSKGKSPQLPLLAVLVSGGHTELVLMKDHGQFERIGETIDDAAGEAFDKVAKMLGLPYPGGPEIAKLAEGGDTEAYTFPRGLMDRPGYDFSFSGVKTSVLYTLRENESLLNDQEFRKNIAASFQEAVVDVLVEKTSRAIKDHDIASVVLAGGVSANIELRKRMKQAVKDRFDLPVLVPPFEYSLDNAAMIAAAGYFRAKQHCFVDPLILKADPNLDIA